jgi:hypothetical protein
MKKKRLKAIFDEIVADYQPLAEMERLYSKAVNSGALDIENEAEEDYRLPKIILYAILVKMAADCKPLHPANLREAETLLLFL